MLPEPQIGRWQPIVPPVESVASADDALVAALLQRDRKATGEFVARYSDRIYSYIRRRLLPRDDLVDDLVQDVFLAAWQNLGNYRQEGPLLNWLLGIARHKVEDYYRAQLQEPLELPDEDNFVAEVAANPRHDDEVEHWDTLERVRRVMASLPKAYSIALLWRYWEQRTTQEIANRTGRTEKAVERLLARARQSFKRRWNDE